MKVSSKQINSGVQIVVESLDSHPSCPHGPTLLFSKSVGPKSQRQFYACSACRDRKLCNFFLWADEKGKTSEEKLTAWETERKKFLKGINHKRKFLMLNKIKALSVSKRAFCLNCSTFIIKNKAKHETHSIVSNITDYQLDHPSEMLPPLENSKKEAQYLFSKDSVQFLVSTFLDLGYKHIICIGTPRIHEYIQSNVPRLQSILLDIDDRFHNFFGPLEFIWYNSFNNHFFFDEAKGVFRNFLKGTCGENTVLITDPPFGGRTEPLINSFSIINNEYKQLNKTNRDLPIFWIFPYFMEPQISNNSPWPVHMLDYKVEYDNHPLFQNGAKGRKHGSPVRIFTNLDPSLIKLPEPAYKFCKNCNKWVSQENKHCPLCDQCTSKNGQTYVHCNFCNRCVKPNWRHCLKCNRCAQVDHKCGHVVASTGVCLNCKGLGHKKEECVQSNKQGRSTVSEKRKGKCTFKQNKKFKS